MGIESTFRRNSKLILFNIELINFYTLIWNDTDKYKVPAAKRDDDLPRCAKALFEFDEVWRVAFVFELEVTIMGNAQGTLVGDFLLNDHFDAFGLTR